MAVNDTKRYWWIKLNKDFFQSHQMRILEAQPNGKEYELFYLKLLCEACSHEGNLRLNDLIPYDENMLSGLTNTNIDIVRSACKVLASLQLLELKDDGTIFLEQVQKMVGSETGSTKRHRESRERAKLGQNLPKSIELRDKNKEKYNKKKVIEPPEWYQRQKEQSAN